MGVAVGCADFHEKAVKIYGQNFNFAVRFKVLSVVKMNVGISLPFALWLDLGSQDPVHD